MGCAEVIVMIPFPDKKYKVIYADPPWSYKNGKTGGRIKRIGPQSGSAQKYNTMTMDEICSLPIDEISNKNCVLFLWGTVPLLPESLEVMKAWGFRYKTTFYWRKIMSLGLGYWFRGQIEFMLVGLKGKIPAFHSQHPNFIQCRVGEHSKKPKEIRGLIDGIASKYKLHPKIELFSRDKIEGWDCWGDEVSTDEQRLLIRDR